MATKGDKNNKPKKVNFFVATYGELKQVSWLSFGETMKRLGAVLVVTAIFLVVLIGVDALLGFIHGELFSIEAETQYLDAAQIAAVIISVALVLGAIAGYVVYKVMKARKKNANNKDFGL